MTSLLRSLPPLWLLSLLLAETLFGWSIQPVSGPEHSGLDGVIHRSTVFRENDTVWYGRCDILEKVCSPESESLQLKRQQTFEEYQTRLAELFNLEAKYLIHHEKTRENQDRLLHSLELIINGNADESEKEEALKKKTAIVAEGGVRDRFLQAVAIKESLDRKTLENGEPFVVTFEKSRKQFKESLWPINFARPINKPEDPLTILEPSTELTWFFGGQAHNRKEAKELCERVAGGRLMRRSEMVSSAKWLKDTAIYEAIPKTKGAHGGADVRKVWLAESDSVRRHAGTATREEGSYVIRKVEYDVYEWDCTFDYAYLYDDGTTARYVYSVKTKAPEQIYDPVGFCGADTTDLSVLCVQDAEGNNHEMWGAN